MALGAIALRHTSINALNITRRRRPSSNALKRITATNLHEESWLAQPIMTGRVARYG
jgi:hypothetical protein